MKAHDRPKALALVALVMGLVLTVWVVLLQTRSNQREAQERLQGLATKATEALSIRMDRYTLGIVAMRGAALASGGPNMSSAAFGVYSNSRDSAAEFPGARAFGIAWRVTENDEARFVARARQDGWPGYAVRQLKPHAGERYLVRHTALVGPGPLPLGLDLASEDNRRMAAVSAMQSGEPTLSAPITLINANGQPLSSFLLLAPIYQPGAPQSTVEERERASLGWSYSVLVIADVLQGLDLGGGQMLVELSDLAGASPFIFYRSPGESSQGARALAQSALLGMHGRSWIVQFRATPSFYESLNLISPAYWGTLGSVLSLLLTSLVYLLAQSRMRDQQIHSEQTRRAAIVESSTDAFILQTFDGRVLDWSPGAQALFGYSAQEAVGQRVADLLLAPDSAHEDAQICEAVARGETVAPFDAIRLHQDRSEVHVSVAVVPLLNQRGERIGISKILRNNMAAIKVRQELVDANFGLECEVHERTAELATTLRDFKNIVNALPSVIGYWDAQLVNRVANHAYGEWFGIDAQQMPGRSMREVLGDRVFQSNQPQVEAVLRGEAQTFERSIPFPDGPGLRHVVAYYLPDVVEGHVKGFYVLVHDQTALVDGQRALAAAQRDNEALLDTIHRHAIVSVADCQGNITEVNDRFCHISGYTREELLGQNHRLVNSGEHGSAFWNDLWAHISAGQSWRGEVCNRAKDGSQYWVDSIVSPFLGADGLVEKYISIRTDITDRKRAERELGETMTLLNAVLTNASQVAVIAARPDGVISVFNPGAERLLGYTADAIVGQKSHNLFHAAGELEERAQKVSQRTGHPVSPHQVLIHPAELDRPFDTTYLRQDGSAVAVQLTMTAMLDEQGQLFGYLGIAHDVSQQKAQEQSLRHAVHKAKSANRAKSQFLANMSHEIRTPMNAVIGLTYLLERTPLDAEQSATLAKIKVAGRSLLSTINEILDFSKIEADELKIESVPFHLGTVVQEVCSLVQVQSDVKKIEFVLDLAAGLPHQLEGDATRLHQVLTNLLTNAVKFTTSGHVKLAVQRIDENPGRAELRFEVSDTGIGMSTQDMSRLFTPFAQADASTTRRFGGTGLGLSIVKRLVGLMGGEVSVRSTPGQGSVFTVTLGFALSQEVESGTMVAPQSGPLGAGLRGVRVLVADDSEINLEVARRVLELEGAVVSLANHGQEAVDHLLANPQGFDVVLLDLQMPVLDGFDASRRIRKGLGLLSLPIVALSASTMSAEMQHAKAAGMNDYLSKPFEVAQLVACIRRWVPAEALPIEMPVDASAKAPIGVCAAQVWPQVEGLDTQHARNMLGNDQTLFCTLLKRLLTESSCLASDPTQAPDIKDLQVCAERLHKLRGTAGILGAKTLAKAASQGEQACRQQQMTAATHWMSEVAQQLRALSHEAAHLLTTWEEAQSKASLAAAANPLDLQQLGGLLDALARSDFEAVTRFEALAPSLRAHLPPDSFTALNGYIDGLQLPEALALLQKLYPQVQTDAVT